MISKTGEHFRRLDINEISKSNPDIIVLMPCSFGTQRTVEEYKKFLKNNSQWKNLEAVKKNQIFTADVNSFFNKPSIRTVEDIEILAKIIQPDKFKNLRVSDRALYILKMTKCKFNSVPVIQHNIPSIISNFNNQYPEQEHLQEIDGSLKMTNHILVQPGNQTNYFLTALTRDTTSTSLNW